MRTLIIWLLLTAGACAQGCGPNNPNCIVPTAPPGTNDNRAASTAFVQAAIGGSGGFSPGNSYTWTAEQIYTGGNLATGVPSIATQNCVLIAAAATTCGARSPWGPAFVPFDVAGIVTVDTEQGGIQINQPFGFYALYQGAGNTHDYPGWAMTLNNDTSLSFYYSATAFLAPVSFTGSISGTTMNVTVASGSQPLGINHVITGSGVTAGTKIVNQLSGIQGHAGTYTITPSQTVPSEALMAGPPTPLVLGPTMTPNWTYLGRSNSVNIQPDSITTVGYVSGLALGWNFDNAGEIDFVNNNGFPGAAAFDYTWNNHIGPKTISSITGSASPYTINYSPGGRYFIGAQLVVSGVTPSSLNGTYTVTSVAGGSATATTTATGTYASGGAIAPLITQTMNIAAPSNIRPGAMLIGIGGQYPNPGAVGRFNVNASFNNIVEVLGCSESPPNTSLATYYLGCVTVYQQQDNIANKTFALDWRAANTSGNDYAAIVGQVTDVTNNAVKGTVTIMLANAQPAALTTSTTFNSSGGVYIGSTNVDPGANNLAVQGTARINGLPTSAGAGGLFVCVDSSGVLYKKATCP